MLCPYTHYCKCIGILVLMFYLSTRTIIVVDYIRYSYVMVKQLMGVFRISFCQQFQLNIRPTIKSTIRDQRA